MTAGLEVESIVLGPPDVAGKLEPWRRLAEDAARIVWRTQTSMGGRLAVALLPGESPSHHEPHRVVVGAYSPETHTVLIFVEGLEKVRRSRSYLRQMMRTLAHETTHAVQHRHRPDTRPGRGSVVLDATAYAADPQERQAVTEENAFDHALFSYDPPDEFGDRVREYRHNFTAEFVEQVHLLEE